MSSEQSVIMAAALVSPTKQGIPICLLNPKSDPVTVYKGTRVEQLELVQDTADIQCDISSAQAGTSEEMKQILWYIVQNYRRRLTTTQEEQFFHLLLTYANVFAKSSTDLGCTTKLQHNIDAGKQAPIRQRVRRLPHNEEEVQKLLQQMLQKNIVRPSKSPWASPVILVKKKDGSS